MKIKKIISLILSTVVLTSFCGIDTLAASISKENSRIISTIENENTREIPFNEEWKFNLGDVEGAKEKDFNDESWRGLTLPHDWSIELDFNKNSPSTHEGGYLDGGIGWYRKSFVIPKSMEGKEISINFNGVYMDSYVYVNGKQVGNHPYGYTPFSFNITDELICDGITENVISVKANNKQPSSRWYSGSGIYRDVSLTVTEKVHVAEYGTYVTTPDLENQYKIGLGKVNVKTDVVNNEDSDKEVSVKSVILDVAGQPVAEDITTGIIKGGDRKNFNADVTVNNPILWGTENPYLYTLETTILINNEIVDKYETDFGMRWFEMTSDEGFFLNGEHMKLKGTSMHHDQGALGAIDNKSSIRRQVKMLKEMGVNSIRVTHNPASDNLIEVCNEEGILLIDEAFDGWYSPKKAYDYGRFFEKKSIHEDMTWAEFDVKQMVHRGKNSPSIIMWSLGNEVWVTQDSKGQQTTRDLRDWVKEIDDTRPTTYGESLFQLGENGQGEHEKACDEVDVVGFNYGDDTYDFFHEKYPNWIIYGSETSSAIRSRGEYSHPEESLIMHNHSDLQQSSYDNDYVSWGKTAEDAWKIDRDRKFVQGQYIWTGFDYIGEPTPYTNKFPSKSSYFGAIDTAGFEKDIFYFYQSQWSDKPMVHLLPHWNWENDDSIKVDGDKILVYAYTNANSVDLYFNENLTSNELGDLVESKSYEVTNAGYNGKFKETADGDLNLEFRVPYKPGKLTAIAKDENGNEIARDEVKTAKESKKIDLSSDRQVISADGYDLSFITVDVLDENGTLVPTADNLINFEVRGNGKIVGVDNGNAASVERYKDNKRKAYNGKALVIVQSTKDAGSFTLTAKSQGLSSDNLTVYTVDETTNENRIVGYDVNDITVPVYGKLLLPETIKAVYLDGTTKDVNVSWDSISEESLQTPGIFTVKGSVEGSDIPASINIIVKNEIGVLDTRILTSIGQTVSLPIEVSVVSNDGSIQNYPVIWERELAPTDFESANIITVQGNIENKELLQPKAIITVSDKVEEVNVALNEGSEYPKPFATYTGGDSIMPINDGIISKGNTPNNRWTNWGKPGENYDEYVGIEFNKEYLISKIGISLFSDFGVAIPSEILVEYHNGVNWVPVINQSKTKEFTVDGTEEITFDAVTTSKIRALLREDTAENKAVGLTEFEVYSNVIKIEGTSLLSDIKIDNVKLDNFNENITQYSVNVPYGKEVSKVTATAKDSASVFIVPALSNNSSSTIYVTPEDGKENKVYVVELIQDDANLISASINLSKETIIEDDIINIFVEGILEDESIIGNKDIQIKYNIESIDNGEVKIEENKLYAYTEGSVILTAEITYRNTTITTEPLTINIEKNPANKTIVSYEKINITTDKGVAPILPKEIKATFDIGFPRGVKVNWNDIKAEDYNKYGKFEVEGTVEGQPLKAKATITVNGISALGNISIVTNVGVDPKLPNTIKAYYTDGTNMDLSVIWDDYNKDLLKKEGVFKVEGKIPQSNEIVEANIRVTKEVELGDNIAGRKNGFDLPLAIASFTNEVSNDQVTHLNDENNNTRWTNWQSVARSEEWVGVIFGTGIPEEKYINNLEINFFEDNGSKIPDNFEIQYYVGDEIVLPTNAAQVSSETENPLNNDKNWKNVNNLISTPENTTVGLNKYNFDMVQTYALRIKMIPKPNMALAINEIRAYEERPISKTDFVVNGIKVNNNLLDEFASDKYDYTITLKENEKLPKVTVDATNNASVSVIYTTGNTENLQVMIKSENGLKESLYNLNIKRESLEVEASMGKITNLKAEAKNKSVKLNWDEPKNTEGLVEYVIYKDGKKLTTIQKEETEIVIDKLRANTIYGFKVAAKYNNNKESKPVSVNVRTKK